MTKTITFGNFKGGVGKTMTSVMTSLYLADKGNKVLFIDFDPQGNASDVLAKTFHTQFGDKPSIYEGLEKGVLAPSIHELGKNLSLIPADFSLVGFQLLLTKLTNNDYSKRAYYLDALLEPLKGLYHYIIIDTPPTISDFTNNAILTSDYIVLVMQTQLWSLYAVETYLPYISQMNETYHSNCSVLGVVNMLLDKNGTVDNDVVRKAKELFGELLFKKIIFNRQRVKRYSAEGIPLEIINNNRHDKETLSMYDDLNDEIFERLRGEFRNEEK